MVVTSHYIRRQFSQTEHFHTPRLTRALYSLGYMLRFNLKSLLTIVAVAAVSVSALLYLRMRHPIEFSVSPDRSALTSSATSNLGSIQVKSVIEHNADLPIWLATQESPPLSAKKAIECASEQIEKIRGQLQCDQVELSRCNLTPWGPKTGHWYWLVEFDLWDDDSAEVLRLHVLMDGSSGEIQITDNDNNRKLDFD